jgi:hypothetical protein
MPVPCKKPRFRYNKKRTVRLTFCGNKVVEAKTKKNVDLERKYNRKVYRGKKGGYYYVTKGRKIYVG